MFLKHLNLKHIDHLKDAISVELLGEGAFGTIELYQCKQVSNCTVCDEYFVVKKIKYKTRFSCMKRYVREIDIERFRNEFKIGIRVNNHPNIRKTLDIDIDCKYIVFENCKGIDLLDYLNLYKFDNTRPLVSLYNQVLDAVCYLHDRGIAHLDLKLENIVLNTDTNILKLIDFGESVQYIQKQTTPQDNTPQDNTPQDNDLYQEFYLLGPRGTFQYISPEQRKLVYFSAPRADIWSCGIILYNLLYNKMPWSIADETKNWNYKLHYNNIQRGILNTIIFKRVSDHFTDTEWQIIKYLFTISLHPCPDKRRSIQFIKSVFSLIIFEEYHYYKEYDTLYI